MTKQQLRCFELVFIPIPGVGHLLPMVEMGQRLMARTSSSRAEEDDRKISAAITILKFPYPDDKIDSYVESLKSEQNNNPHPITVLEVPPVTAELPVSNPLSFLTVYMDEYKPIIKQALLDRYHYHDDDTPQLAGLVLDMFCTAMMDVGDELGVPSYIFFTSGASPLSLTFHLDSLGVDVPQTYGTESETQTLSETSVKVAGFSNPIPVKVWPTLLFSKFGADMWFGHAKRYRRSKGIVVNTFMELESSIIQSLSSPSSFSSDDYCIPPIYPVGPILNLPKESNINSVKNREIISWLDSQPPSSVVFLCFGSRGSFDVDQVREIAAGLERSGHKFLWSLRSRGASSSSSSSAPPPSSSAPQTDKNNNNSLKFPQLPGEYEDLSQVLPEGFLDRTSQVGKVIGWAPQVEVLAHKAVGAFVSHCGWNSTLESLWFGVPMLTWPMYAEQQMNAFLLVKELGLAMEIKIDYRNDFRINNGVANMLVGAEVVEAAIKSMMESEQGQLIRNKVKHVSESARKAVLQTDGSSNISIDRFAENVHKNIVSK